MRFNRLVSRRAFVRMTGAGLLFTSFMATGVAFAADPQAGSADKAVALVNRPLAGHLEGSASGNFAYYKFDYPGDGSVATVNMQITPDDVFILKSAGMVLFGLDGTPLISGGQQPKLSPNVSGNVIFTDPNKRGSYVIQVYNYNPQTAIDFTIWVAGIPVPAASDAPAVPGAPPAPVAAPVIGAPAPIVAAPAAPIPAPAAAPAPVGKNDTGDRAIQLQPGGSYSDGLEGDSGGKFRYFKLQYPGDGSTLTINLQVTPDDATLLKSAGFNVYGPTPNKTYVTGGAQQGLNPNVSGNLVANEGGTYFVQVYNYNPGTAVNFTLTTAGLTPQPASVAAPAPAAAPAPVAAPAPAAAPAVVAPAPAAPAAPSDPSQPTGVQSANSFSGHLNGGGKTALYEFTYPGDQSVFTIGVNITPNDPAVLQNAGFKVYGPVKDKIYATGGTQPGLTPNVLGNVISRDPGTYVIQVYNFSQAPIDYTVSLSTAPPPGEVLSGQGKTP